jgi:photosystem II stability/assembly factor-like uncharacterized protein
MKRSLLLFFIFLLAQGTRAQWNKVYEFDVDMHDMWFINKDTGFICGSAEYPVLMRTFDGGYTWEDITSNITDPVYAVNFLDESKGFIATWGYSSKDIRATFDSGWTWESKFSTTPYINTITFPSSQVGYSFASAMEYVTVVKTSDGGDTFEQVAFFTTPAAGLGVPDAQFVTESVGYLVTNSGAVYKTVDGGWNWDSQYQSMELYSMTGICFLNQDTGFVTGETTEYGYPEGLLLKTINGGQYWEENFFNYPCDDIWFTHPDTGYMAAQGILKSTDGGISWIKDTCNFPVYPEKFRFPTPLIGYAMMSYAGKTVLMKRDPDVGVSVKENHYSESLSVWPVPAHDQINVRFNISSKTRCTAELLNCSGISLRTLTQAGYTGEDRTVRVDVSSFPPGIYYIRMLTEQGTYLKKVVIL